MGYFSNYEMEKKKILKVFGYRAGFRLFGILGEFFFYEVSIYFVTTGISVRIQYIFRISKADARFLTKEALRCKETIVLTDNVPCMFIYHLNHDFF